MLCDNLQLLQRGPPDVDDDDASPPLILVHDGGGTTFPYSRMGNLNRDVWGLRNPKYYSGKPWEGGMEEMARHYISLIEEAGLQGPINLGGWSLGGYVSILMAYLLAQGLPASFYVTGLLIIDSPYHVAGNRTQRHIPPAANKLPSDRVQASFRNALDMLSTWELPNCNACSDARGVLSFETEGKEYSLSDNYVLHFTLHGSKELIGSRRRITSSSEASFESLTSVDERVQQAHAGSLPPAVLIRCVRPTPDSRGPFRSLDRFREDETLGWANNYYPFIKAVLDTDSHHFNVFDSAKVSETTRKVRNALEMLESMRSETGSSRSSSVDLRG